MPRIGWELFKMHSLYDNLKAARLKYFKEGLNVKSSVYKKEMREDLSMHGSVCHRFADGRCIDMKCTLSCTRDCSISSHLEGCVIEIQEKDAAKKTMLNKQVRKIFRASRCNWRYILCNISVEDIALDQQQLAENVTVPPPKTRRCCLNHKQCHMKNCSWNRLWKSSCSWIQTLIEGMLVGQVHQSI